MITSSSNAKIKDIRKLRNRKFREESGLFFAEGSRIVIEAIEHGADIKDLIVTPRYAQSDIGLQVINRANEKKLHLLEVSEEVFQSLSQKEGPQGIGAVISQKWSKIESLTSRFSGVWLGLYEIADPGNLGTIIRTCDATGIRHILLIGNCTDPYDPTALRACMGGIFSKELFQLSTDNFIDLIKHQGINVIGTADSAEIDYRSFRFPEDMILMMGSEREGLPLRIAEICKAIVRIPMQGSCDSLNLAVATGVVLYEILYQHII